MMACGTSDLPALTPTTYPGFACQITGEGSAALMTGRRGYYFYCRNTMKISNQAGKVKSHDPKFKPVTVGIMGGSASGKTTFAKELAKELSSLSSVILHQDYYFKDWSSYPAEVREKLATANHPDAICWEALIGHIEQLVARQPIEIPAPGTRAAARSDESATVQPGDVVIVEGHLILWDETLRNFMDVKLFMDVDPHERVLRRLLRDVGERGGDLERAVAWYRRDVIPNFPVYTEPCKQYADLILPFQDGNPVALRMIAAGIREMIPGERGWTL
jgi:uridine kinase